jgi:hypothetical protein
MQRIAPASRQDLLTILSTEHFTLQGARAAAISDANGRTGFYLSTLSAGVVALAFVSQVDQTGPAFTVLALILLPTLLIIGLASFERLLQLGIENIRTVVAINRVRRYYLEVAPELRAHITLSDNDDAHGVLISLGSTQGGIRPWDLYVTNAGLMAIINSIVAGTLGALVAVSLGATISAAVVVGIVTGGILLVALSYYLTRRWRSAIQTFGVRFASGTEVDLSHALLDDEDAPEPPS